MATVRMNTMIRDELTKLLLTRRFGPDIDNLISEQAKFADAVYKDVYSERDRKLMESLPEGWLPEKDNIMVQFGPDIHRVQFNGSKSIHDELSSYKNSEYPRSITRRVTQQNSRYCAKIYSHKSKFTKENLHLENVSVDLRDAIRRAKVGTTTALATFTTVSSLIKGWPEVAPFAEKYLDSSLVVRLPAIASEQLNSMLDLPPDSDEEAVA